MLLIAEIGSNHFGSMDKAKELIRAANNAGADLVKGQAFRAEDIKHGSMHPSFYEACALSENQCLELMDYADNVGIEMFFSIFSDGYGELARYQPYQKIAGSQTRAGRAGPEVDQSMYFISVPIDAPMLSLYKFKRAQVLYVSDYLPVDPQLGHIELLSQVLDRPVGYSDHTIGIDACVQAVEEYGAPVIEKHFCLSKDAKWLGHVYRDTTHGATPEEFTELANRVSHV